MKRDDLLDSIGGLDPAIVEESRRLREKRKAGRKPLAIAVPIAAAAVLAAGVLLAVLSNSIKTNTASGDFHPGEPVETVSLDENVSEAEEAARKLQEEAEKQAVEAASRAAGTAYHAEDSAADDQNAPLFGLELEISVPEEIINYVEDHSASIRTEIMHSQFDGENDAGKDLRDLVLLHPFVIYKGDGKRADMGFPSWYFPVMTKDRIACTVVLTQANGEVLMGKTLNFNDDLNALIGDEKEHRAVLKETALTSDGDHSSEQETRGVPRPEYEFPETGRTVAGSPVFWDLSIENTADESVFSIIPGYDPYLDRFNTHVFYYDGACAVFRIHHDEEERLVMMKKSGSGWETFRDIRSVKHTMCDRASEITEAFEDFYGYYMHVFESGLTEDLERMTAFLHDAAIPNYDDLNAGAGQLKFTDEELKALRDRVRFEYDPEISEKWIPAYLAAYTSVDNGWLKLTGPVVCFRMDCPESEDPELQTLTERYFGGSTDTEKPQYYILSAYTQQERPDLFNVYPVPRDEEFFPGTSFIGMWISGKLD